MTALRSFGGTASPAARAIPAEQALALLKSGRAAPGSLLAFGNGRSYGDSCLNGGGSVIEMRARRRILGFDPSTGILEAEAGVFLSEIIARAVPAGYFPPVLPGTQFVTLGGAIANDVHGKNHHRRGSFGRHVLSFTLLRSDGTVAACSRRSNPALFAATIGGMGLTGLILSASVQLMPVRSTDIVQRVTPFASLDAFFELAEAADRDNEYAVAWIDQLAGGRSAGRGLMITGNHADGGSAAHGAEARQFAVPFQPPATVLNRPALKLFNAGYRWSNLRNAGPRRVDWRGFFFPLDAVRDWNRLYGPRGLYQHQSVLPTEAAPKAISDLLEASRRAGHGSFLSVLKRFGDLPSPGVLSFARSGYTLTLDFPNRGPATVALLDRLDAITVAAGGAVNPYKDARMSAAVFAASFPGWRRLEAMRDPAFMSDFWSRTAMRLDETPLAVAAE